MVKILFLCHGNICRSPMAEAVFRDMLKRRGLSERYEVDSAAVSSEEVGNPVDFSANRELERHGLPRSEHRAWQITREDYDRYDYFIGMDRDNVIRMRMIFGGDEKGKTGMLMGFTDEPREIEDPWFTGRFEHVYEEIVEGCEALLEELLRDERSAQRS